MIKEIFHYYSIRGRRYFEENKLVRLVVAGLMLVIIFLIALGIFILSKQGLEFTQIEDDFMAQALPLYLYQIFLLITGFLIFISTTIFGLVNFFKTSKDLWIMASPQYLKIFWVNILRAIISYSWPIVIIIIPLIIAAGQIFNFSWLAFSLALFAVVLFATICSLLAILLLLIVASIITSLNLKNFKLLTTSLGVLTLFIAVFIWQKVVKMNLEQIFQVNEVFTPSLTPLENHFAAFPSHLPAMVVYYLQQNNLSMALEKTGIIILFILGIVLLLNLLKINFLKIWQTFQEGSFEAKNKLTTANNRGPLTSFPKSPEGVIYRKELFTSWRSAKNLLWFIFLSVLLFAQVGVISLLGKYSELGGLIIGDIVLAIQLSIILFFISAFILRFVFPSFSQESSTAWLIGSAPISLTKIFTTKYKFYSIVLLLVGIISLLIYVIPLGVNWGLAIGLLIIMAVAILTLNMLGLALGAIFINFKTNDPNELSTSAPGITFTLISLAYAGLGSYLLYLAINLSGYWPIIIFIIISAIIYQLSKEAALKSLKKLEFV